MTQEVQSIVSLVISCLAFLVSGVALGWSIYRDILDKGRLKIEIIVGRVRPGASVCISSEVYAEMVRAKEIPDDAGPHLAVATITNLGKRPIVAMKWAGRRSVKEGRKEWFVFVPRALPKTLQPGEFTMEWSENPIVFKNEVRGFYVFDSTGRQWKASRINVREFKSVAQKFVGEGGKR